LKSKFFSIFLLVDGESGSVQIITDSDPEGKKFMDPAPELCPWVRKTPGLLE
jgi:hypothetical protein